jgi:hypothetical protein
MEPEGSLELELELELSANLVQIPHVYVFLHTCKHARSKRHRNPSLRHICDFLCRVLSMFPERTTERRHFSFEHKDDRRFILSEEEIWQIKQNKELFKRSETMCITQRPTYTPHPHCTPST